VDRPGRVVPDHGARWPTDVVLIYDLEKSPSQNRLGAASTTQTPPPTSDTSTWVGFPVYPSANAANGNYMTVVPDGADEGAAKFQPYEELGFPLGAVAYDGIRHQPHLPGLHVNRRTDRNGFRRANQGPRTAHVQATSLGVSGMRQGVLPGHNDRGSNWRPQVHPLVQSASRSGQCAF
jgi:hypothetical protein